MCVCAGGECTRIQYGFFSFLYFLFFLAFLFVE